VYGAVASNRRLHGAGTVRAVDCVLDQEPLRASMESRRQDNIRENMNAVTR